MPMLSADLEHEVAHENARVVALFSRDGIVAAEVIRHDNTHWLFFDQSYVLQTGEAARMIAPDDYGMGFLVLGGE
jgi:hypothetical protein